MEQAQELAATLAGDRVRMHTPEHVNRRHERDLEMRARQYASAEPAELGRRLGELEREWHIDRALMANFAIAGSVSLGLALRSMSRRRSGRRLSGWFYVLTAQTAFLFLHATVGWCPPVVVFRRLGLRTEREIAADRQLVLNALRRQAADLPTAH